MLRITLLAGLLASLLLLARGIAVTLQEETVQVAPMVERRAAVATGKPGFAFYPPVPLELPDLNQGYIFSEARELVQKPETGPKEEILVAMDELSYVGSVISRDRRIGIVSYLTSAVGFRQVADRHSKNRQAGNKHVHLAPGESFSGYLVDEVLPDRIVFVRDGMKIEKPLIGREDSLSSPIQAGRKKQERPSSGNLRSGRLERSAGVDHPGSV